MHEVEAAHVTVHDAAVRRVLAPNPSPMTEAGTNTYIVGRGRVGIIDPGPDRPEHLDAILAALRPGETVSHIMVTHSHLDHSPLSRSLSQFTGAPTMAFGASRAGMSDLMTRIAARASIGGGEGVDADFLPDIQLTDRQKIVGENWEITAHHTPGHMSNHMCFAFEDAMFTGDQVMGWASSLISPPDGDLGAFMNSCRKLLSRDDRIYYPGHGSPVAAPRERVKWLIAHREQRENQILNTLSRACATPQAITSSIYHETDPGLHPAATRNVFAHLIDLYERNVVTVAQDIHPDAVFSLN